MDKLTPEQQAEFLKTLDDMHSQIVSLEAQLDGLKDSYLMLRQVFFPPIMCTMTLQHLEKALKNTFASTPIHVGGIVDHKPKVDKVPAKLQPIPETHSEVTAVLD